MIDISSNDIWKVFAGLGLFLYGMFQLEEGVKNLEGRSFKLFLQNHTKKKISAIISGTFVTAVLQSSSLVNLIVLSFVGAGILSMRNALSVTLGANIGGTFNSWIVALLGFKFDLDSYTFPLIAISIISLLVFKNKMQLQLVSKIGLGISFIFLGMHYMKESMEFMLSHFDFSAYLEKPRIVFVIIGFVITALVQTSSATVVLALSALYTGIMTIETAVAVVIGAEFGTTLKLLLGSLGGSSAKQKVAWANILFNLLTSFYGFVLITPILYFLSEIIGIHDPIFLLVSFQTFLNISGVILVFFFIDRFVEFLDKNIKFQSSTSIYFLETTSPEITEFAMPVLEKEVDMFIYSVIRFNLKVMEISTFNWADNEFKRMFVKQKKTDETSLSSDYIQLKETEGEVLTYCSKLSALELQETSRWQLNQLMSSVRNAMYSAKGMKDIHADVLHLKNSANDAKYNAYLNLQDFLNEFYRTMNSLIMHESQLDAFEILSFEINHISKKYEEWTGFYVLKGGAKKLKGIELSTLINLNREVYSSSRALIVSIKDRILNKESAENFENLPQLYRT